MTQAGSRIGAIYSVDNGDDDGVKAVDLLGYGVYEGDFIPQPGEGGALARGMNFSNPKIKLDDGQIIWGCECWWGPEDKVREKIAAYEAQGYITRMVTNMAEIRKINGVE